MENINDLMDDVKELKNKVQAAEHNLEMMAKKTGRKFREVTSGYVNTGREYVIENPVKGIALAAVTGAVVGSLITFGISSRD
jgi:ElaB/YqjD/DUF883 family membrane-anchored ribosome-binding protein